jgi:hypothetical protein
MSNFLKTSNIIRPSNGIPVMSMEALEPRMYTLQCDQVGFFLEHAEDFTMPPKLYGNTIKHRDRILKTFNSRPAGTGILLTGEKGSGKTLLAKSLCLEAASSGIPTILINSPLRGNGFNMFIQSIKQDCIVLFDEFEKVYSREQQQDLLTVLDGVLNSKKLFIFTCNDKYGIDSYMINRPGRIYYLIEFEGIDSSFVTEYCKDNEVSEAYTKELIEIVDSFTTFNFDMLKAIVEEVKRYNERPARALELLNINHASSGEKSQYTYSFSINGKPPVTGEIEEFLYNPTAKRFAIDVSGYPEIMEQFDQYDVYSMIFKNADCVSSDLKKMRFKFEKTESLQKYEYDTSGNATGEPIRELVNISLTLERKKNVIGAFSKFDYFTDFLSADRNAL